MKVAVVTDRQCQEGIEVVEEEVIVGQQVLKVLS